MFVCVCVCLRVSDVCLASHNMIRCVAHQKEGGDSFNQSASVEFHWNHSNLYEDEGNLLVRETN